MVGPMTTELPVLPASAAWVPDACTLPTVEQPLRQAEFDALFTHVTTVERISRTHLQLDLAGSPDLEDRIGDLAARETQCCSFFQFDITSDEPGHVRLSVEVPLALVDVLDALTALATAKSGTAR